MEMNVDKEILNSFVEESNQVLGELTGIVEQIEDASAANPENFPSQLMEDFSQRIDRIMGAAKTISVVAPEHPGFIRIGKLAELCKLLGYKAAERKSSQLLPIFAAFWSDTIEVTQALLDAVEDLGKTEEISKSFSVVLQKRLEWLLSRTAIQAAGKTAEPKMDEARQLLKMLGF